MGASIAQSRSVQYACCGVVRRQGHPGDPLAGAHEAVEAGHDHARREAVLAGQRLAVHADRDERVTAVERHVERRRDGHPVDVGGEDLVGLGGVDAGLREDVREGYAEPAGAADVGAAHLVGDAGEGDVALDGLHRREVVEGQGDLLVDVAVDGERPRVDVDGGDRQAGVDPVEVGVRRTQRADAVVRLLQSLGGRWARGRWQPAARCPCRRGGRTSPSDRAPPWPLQPRRGRRLPARPRAGSDRRPHATDRSEPGRRRGAATTAMRRRQRRRPGQERCPAARSPGAGRRARRRRRRVPPR